MVWTLAQFKTATNLRLQKRSEGVLLAVDNALRAYDLVRPSGADTRRRAALGVLDTAIDGWILAKQAKVNSSRRAAIVTLKQQVQLEIQRVDARLLARQLILNPIPQARIAPPTVQFDQVSGTFVYYDPNTNRSTPVTAADWEIRNYNSSARRYYRNKVIHFHKRVEPDDWVEQFDDQDNNKSVYYSLPTGLTTRVMPPELSAEILRAREIEHFIRGSKWVPDDYYDIESDTERGPSAASMTAYRKNLSTLNSDKDAVPPQVRRIKRQGTLHLTIREDIQTAKLTSGPWSARSKAPVDLAQINVWEGVRQVNPGKLAAARTLARRAVRLVRAFLPLGAFNNRGGVVPPPDTWSRQPGIDMQRLEQLAGTLLGTSTDFLHAMACNAAAVRALGGGVCSMIGAFTAGVLSVISPANTEVLYCYHSADHAYCVVSFDKSEWICADPWPLVPFPAKWAGSYFEPTALMPLKYYTKIEVHLPVRIPFGLVETADESLEYSAVLDTATRCPGSPGEIGHPYGHLSNTRDNTAPSRYEGERPIVKKKDWGPRVDCSAEFPEISFD